MIESSSGKLLLELQEMTIKRFVEMNKFFENDEEKETEKEPKQDTKVIDAIDAQIQRRMGDIAKIREMYTDVTKEVGDSEDVKQTFMERLGKLIHASEEGNEEPKL